MASKVKRIMFEWGKYESCPTCGVRPEGGHAVKILEGGGTLAVVCSKSCAVDMVKWYDSPLWEEW